MLFTYVICLQRTYFTRYNFNSKSILKITLAHSDSAHVRRVENYFHAQRSNSKLRPSVFINKHFSSQGSAYGMEPIIVLDITVKCLPLKIILSRVIIRICLPGAFSYISNTKKMSKHSEVGWKTRRSRVFLFFYQLFFNQLKGEVSWGFLPFLLKMVK